MAVRADRVTSLERALVLLELMAEEGGELTLARLADVSGLPRSTVLRLIRTLVARGYVRRSTARRYVLGPRMSHLAEGSARAHEHCVRADLTGLVRGTGAVANLAVLEAGRAMYVVQVPPAREVPVAAGVGGALALHCSGVGKILLAERSPASAWGLLGSGLTGRTERTITDADRLAGELARVTEQGYAVDDEEHERGVRCIAVPVRGWGSMALSVSGPPSALPLRDVRPIVELLRAAAAGVADRVRVTGRAGAAAGHA